MERGSGLMCLQTVGYAASLPAVPETAHCDDPSLCAGALYSFSEAPRTTISIFVQLSLYETATSEWVNLICYVSFTPTLTDCTLPATNCLPTLTRAGGGERGD